RSTRSGDPSTNHARAASISSATCRRKPARVRIASRSAELRGSSSTARISGSVNSGSLVRSGRGDAAGDSSPHRLLARLEPATQRAECVLTANEGGLYVAVQLRLDVRREPARRGHPDRDRRGRGVLAQLGGALEAVTVRK